MRHAMPENRTHANYVLSKAVTCRLWLNCTAFISFVSAENHNRNSEYKQRRKNHTKKRIKRQCLIYICIFFFLFSCSSTWRLSTRTEGYGCLSWWSGCAQLYTATWNSRAVSTLVHEWKTIGSEWETVSKAISKLLDVDTVNKLCVSTKCKLAPIQEDVSQYKLLCSVSSSSSNRRRGW